MIVSGSYETISQAWFDSLGKVYHHGDVMDTEYGNQARYVNGFLVEIEHPVRVWHKLDPWCSEKRIDFYKKQFKRASIGTQGFEYTYIDRMVNYPGEDGKVVDQLKWMHDQLVDHRYESRRIMCITWIPKIDCFKKEDQPCYQGMFVFPRRNNKLDVHIHYRSWDLFKALEANLMGFQEVIRDELLEDTDFTLGVMKCMGDNVHIYSDDWSAVETVLARKVA